MSHLNITTKGIKKTLHSRHTECEVPPLVESKKVLMPPVHIKLVLVKQFVRAMNAKGKALKHLFDMFSHVKRQNGRCIFIGPDIHNMLQLPKFKEKKTRKEQNAWWALRQEVKHFHGSNKSENYTRLVTKMDVFEFPPLSPKFHSATFILQSVNKIMHYYTNFTQFFLIRCNLKM